MGNFVQKFKDMWAPPEDEYDYEEEILGQDDLLEGHAPRENSRRETNTSPNKVVNIHSTVKLQVALFKPERFGEDTRNIADELLKMHTVVLNLESTNSDVSRRIIDFLSGVAYANGGKIKKVATATFVITPYNVEFAGDSVLDELENSGMCF